MAKETKTLSRGTGINIEKCAENVGGNRFNLVLIAAARAREIQRKNRHAERYELKFPNVTALQEIEEGKVGKEYLLKV